jgi:hypothetical protein
MNNTSPAFPELLCILLFMAFVVGLDGIQRVPASLARLAYHDGNS